MGKQRAKRLNYINNKQKWIKTPTVAWIHIQHWNSVTFLTGKKNPTLHLVFFFLSLPSWERCWSLVTILSEFSFLTEAFLDKWCVAQLSRWWVGRWVCLRERERERERDRVCLWLTHYAASCCHQKESRGTIAAKMILWQQHYESKTSGQQKHWRELFYWIPLCLITIVWRKKRHFCCLALDYCPLPQWERCSYHRAYAGLFQ